jgi:transposase
MKPFLLNYHALFDILYLKTLCTNLSQLLPKTLIPYMYQSLPTITEDLDILQVRLRSERDAQLRPRLHLLVLLKSGQITTRRQAAAHLAVHRNTVALWLRTYRAGGLPALVTHKEAGAPSGQKSLPAAVFAQLQARLASPSGFASYGAIQQWLREAFALEGPYQTLYGIVHYQLKAKLKRPRPSHAKKKRLRQRTLSSSVRAAWVPSPP